MKAPIKTDEDTRKTADMKRLALWLVTAAALLAGLVAAWTFMMRFQAPVGDPATYDDEPASPELVGEAGVYEDELREPTSGKLPSGDPGTYEEPESNAGPAQHER